jgi:ATP-dependent DNA helicase RecG
MKLDDIKSLIAQGESHTLEFKKSTTQLKATFETLCAFLNEGGGIVLIGVKNNGEIIGQNVSDSTRQEIAREIRKLEPPTQFLISYIPIGDGKEVISLQVPSGSYKPYVYGARPYQRIESTTVLMPQHRYEQLLVQRGHLNHGWDDLPATGYGIEDLDQDEIRRTILQGIEANRISADALQEDYVDILERLNLITDRKITNAAVVLFSKDIHPNFSQCHIQMARFRGKDKLSGFIDSRNVDGNAFALLEEASIFIQRHLAVASFFQKGSIVRVDHPDLPVLAVREALVNAICHHDYSNRSGYISLAIYEDRLEIWSYGLLPNGLKIDDLKKQHISAQRNKLISDIIYKRGLVEKWGTGTLTMIKLCKEHGVSEPAFEEYSGGFSVTFTFKEQKPEEEKVSPDLEMLSTRQQKIYNLLLREGPLGPKDILSKLEEAITDRTLRQDLSNLRNLNLLDSKGQTQAAVWFVKK